MDPSADWFAPVTLIGEHVVLEPLEVGHVAGLSASCAGDPEVFRWVAPYDVPDSAAMRRVVHQAVDEREQRQRIPFAQVRTSDGHVVGSTSYLDLSVEDRRLEIGSTFLARDAWRTAVNSEAKLLLLTHAFESLGCERVSLKTDHLNERSQQAIARLGAEHEGVLRHHKLRADGSWRDTVYYSILRSEWPAVRDRLKAALTQR